MNKKIIFFDGDGTLWYPSATKRTQKPHWIYSNATTKENVLAHLELTPGTKQALERLQAKGLKLAVISANPHDEAVAIREITDRTDHFGITELFVDIRASAGEDPQGKSAVMLGVLKRYGLTKDEALMVGDSYTYDYLAAKNVGIDAFFIENTVSTVPEVPPSDLQTVREVIDLVDIIE